MFNLFITLFFILSVNFAEAADVLFLNKDIKKGELISKNNLSIGAINSQTSRGYISSINSDNVRAKKDLEAGKPLKKTDIYIDNYLIKKGDIVSAKFIKKNLIIEVKTSAISSGAIGDTIKVKTLDTNKLLTGKIAEDGSIFLSN